MYILHTAILAATLLAQAPTQSHQQTLERVDALSDQINMGEAVDAELHAALLELHGHAPALAADQEARAARTRAQLNLARAYLVEGDRDAAARIMDEVLCSTSGEDLDLAGLGPALAALHAERLEALSSSGRGVIEVRCRVPCRVYINERSSGATQIEDLFLGEYRIWVEAENDPGELLLEQIELSDTRPHAVVEFGSVPAPRLEVDRAAKTEGADQRVMPMPAETALVAIGTGMTIVGVVLLATNSNSERERSIVGGAMTGLGAAAMVLGGVTFGVDQVRINGVRGRQVTVGWRMRF